MDKGKIFELKFIAEPGKALISTVTVSGFSIYEQISFLEIVKQDLIGKINTGAIDAYGGPVTPAVDRKNIN